LTRICTHGHTLASSPNVAAVIAARPEPTECTIVWHDHTAIDNWQEFGGPREAFPTNVTRFATLESSGDSCQPTSVRSILHGLNPCVDHLFDASHETQNYDGVALALPALNWQKCTTVRSAHCTGPWRPTGHSG
jgi:hypothetical protein